MILFVLDLGKFSLSLFDRWMFLLITLRLSKLENVPKTPKQRYKIMTEEMPKNGKLSLDMMYQNTQTANRNVEQNTIITTKSNLA